MKELADQFFRCNDFSRGKPVAFRKGKDQRLPGEDDESDTGRIVVRRPQEAEIKLFLGNLLKLARGLDFSDDQLDERMAQAIFSDRLRHNAGARSRRDISDLNSSDFSAAGAAGNHGGTLGVQQGGARFLQEIGAGVCEAHGPLRSV